MRRRVNHTPYFILIQESCNNLLTHLPLNFESRVLLEDGGVHLDDTLVSEDQTYYSVSNKDRRFLTFSL